LLNDWLALFDRRMNRPRALRLSDKHRKDDVMSCFKTLLMAGAASLTFASAPAAALAPYPPAPPPPLVVQDCCFSGWYLRGNVGMANPDLKNLNNPDPAAQGFATAGLGLDSGSIF